MNNDTNSDEVISARLQYFAERLNLIFSYFFCISEFENDGDFTVEPDFAVKSGMNDRAWALKTIQNACLTATLIALRDLDDFFTPRNKKSRPDDFKACDLGFLKNSFLTNTEREEISKQIVHSTYPGMLTVGYRWDVFELTRKAIHRALEFLKWMEEPTRAERCLTWSAAIAYRHKVQAIYDHIREEVVVQRLDKMENIDETETFE